MYLKTLYFGLISVLLITSCKQVSQDQALKQDIEVSTNKGLKDWSDLPIGGAINISKVLKDSKLDSITHTNFNSITATNDMKMYALVEHDSIPDFTNVDRLVAYTQKHDMRLFGHALVWYYNVPEWITNMTNKKGAAWADAYLKKYITTVLTRYKDDVVAWDVVNEAFADKSGEFRDEFWFNTFGKDYIEKAFRYAHDADPDAKLFYNDFGHERHPEKLNGIVAMVNDLVKRDVPIHGIGLQMHLEMDTTEKAIANALKLAASTGLLIHISELDIIFNTRDENAKDKPKITTLTHDMEMAQAEKFKQVVMLYRKHVPKTQQFGITFWDFNDRDTWIKPFYDLKEWPTIFDENLDPKPGYYGFLDGLTTGLENATE
ncbi:endo-1,4-beta-xylanase [Algibacter amylolyticus]|uniref:Beta-xylanase n=1 Tax=Algibacter amylolyticus TaxID=1608400 RepID=A0A5M7BF67_9FLAO|nr:endo-1,4-beta-xylanase [Algibacter amylolyticus]KAA5827560.1 endo-1,4-beta-xylanase [Algibacter amylolyticus]MBB5266766.1 endo-1,4-beta-xylanase [Algibacter amylolyticus]TSJ81805.1 endo-1,4-beta-xylanase [Algibacter amylolyticus]